MSMYKLAKIASVFAIAATLSSAAAAGSSNAEDYVRDFENIIPEESQLNKEELIDGVGVDRLLGEIFGAVKENGGEIISFFLLLVGLGMAGSLADFSSGLGNERLSASARAGISAISALMIFSRLEGLVFSVRESLDVISSFFSSLIPIITGISLAGGALNSAGIQAVNMNITLSVIGKITSDFLMPLIFIMFSLALVSSVGDGGTARLASGARSVFMWALGIITTVLVAAISMQSFLATAKDSAALRAAKYALSGTIPIVGSTVSGALSTLTGALTEAGAFVGVGSVAVIFIMASSPIILMLLYRLAISVSMWLFEFIGSRSVKNAASGFRSALDSLISVYAVSAVVYVLEVAIFIRGGVNVFV